MALRRRFPLYTRPIPFLAGWVMLVAGVWLGFNWEWSTSIFSGSVLIQTLIPSQLIVFEGVKMFWLLVALAGLALLAFFSYGTRSGARRGGAMAPKWSFFPLVFFLGLFLLFFGAYWLFDLRFAFDDTPGGFVMFTSLNYAGVTSRPFIGTIGLVLFSLGAALTLGLSLDFRIRDARSEPEPEPRGTDQPAAASTRAKPANA